MKRLLALVLTLLLVSVGSLPAFAEEPEIIVGMSNYGSTSKYWLDVGAAAHMRAAELGLTYYELRFEGDSTTQMSQLEDLMSKGVNLMISFVAVQGGPCDPFFAELKADRDACVVVIDSDSDSADYWIKSNDYEIGQIQGEQCANYLLETKGEVAGKIVVISHKSYQNMIARAEGFKDYLSQYPGIEFIDERFPTDLDASLMMQLTEDILQVYAPGDIDILYCTNQTETEGANSAIISANRQDVILFGVDDSDTLREALQDPASTLQSTVAQSPAEMGRQAVDYGVAWLKGEADGMDDVYEAPLRLITRDNVLEWIEEQEELDSKLEPYYQH